MSGANADIPAPPPCPACDAQLYGWVVARDPVTREALVVDRCEECGLGLTRRPEPVDVEAELASLRAPGAGEGVELTAANRSSLQAALGAGHWAALDPAGRRLHLTPRSAELLLVRRGWRSIDVSHPLWGDNQRSMWQTLVNAFTLHDNFAREARAGRLRPSGGRGRAAFALDALVTALVAIPLAIVAVPLEALAASLRRGGEIVVRAERGPGSRS